MQDDLPGWTTYFKEVSFGAFKVTLIDKYGRQAEATGVNEEATTEQAVGYAFDIEKQVSKQWNYFLYKLCLLKIDKEKIIKREYRENAFGTWYVDLAEKIIVYDGKDACLISQSKIENEEGNKTIINNSDLSYSKLIELIRQ